MDAEALDELENPIQTIKKRGRPAKTEIKEDFPAKSADVPVSQAATVIKNGYKVKQQPKPSAEDTIGDSQRVDRRLKQSQKTWHDLFKLDLQFMRKNINGDLPTPNIVDVEHVHFFHTVDSDGRPQDKCSPIGGHFHRMKVIPQGPGKPPLVQCVSGPLKMAKRGNKVVEAPVEDDDHVHAVSYIDSQEIEIRKKSVVAAQVQAMVESQTSPSFTPEEKASIGGAAPRPAIGDR